MSLFTIFRKSLYCFNEYINLIKIGKFKLFLYTIILSIIFSLTYLAQFNYSYIKLGGTKQILQEYVPDFKIENENLYVNDVIEYTNYPVKILVDTQNETSISDFSDFSNVILITSDKIFLKSSSLIQEISIKEISSSLNIYSKEDLINSSVLINSIYKQVLVFVYIFSLIFSYIIIIIMLILLTFIVKLYFFRDKSLNISFKQIFRITALANTLPLLSNLIFVILGLTTHLFIYLGMFLVIIYLVSKEINTSLKTNNT